MEKDTLPTTPPKPYIDPVSLEPIKDAFILTCCGHTFDRSTIENLTPTLHDKDINYKCPLCNRTSNGFTHNYAVNEMMGLQTTGAVKIPFNGDSDPDAESQALDTKILAAINEQIREREKHILECDRCVQSKILEFVTKNHKESFYDFITPMVMRNPIRIKTQDFTCFDSYKKFMIWLTVPYHGLFYARRFSNIQLKLKVYLTDKKHKVIKEDRYEDWRNKWSEIYICVEYVTNEEDKMLKATIDKKINILTDLLDFSEEDNNNIIDE